MPTPKNDVTAKLIAAFKSLISEGTPIDGAKLPPERELARKFRVSRSSLRQALKVLETLGVVTQRVGDGTYFNAAPSSLLGEPMDFLIRLGAISKDELFELRLLVEPEMAARAAERATPQDILDLRQVLRRMAANRADPLKFLEQDVAFHDLIYRLSGNRVFPLLFTVIHRAMLTSFVGLPLEAEGVLAFHRSILAAIARRQPERARARMAEHLKDSRDILRRQVADRNDARLLERIAPIAR